jgi:hypothetical protein
MRSNFSANILGESEAWWPAAGHRSKSSKWI